MNHPLLMRLAAVVFVVASTETAAPSRQAAQSIAFTRLDMRLEGLEPGTAVIRDSLTWRTLWWYFGREYRSAWDSPLPDSIATPPPVDFARNVVVAVNATFGGCNDEAITRIDSHGARLRVVLGVAEPPPVGMVCFRYPEVGSILEAVVVPGRWRQVSFVGARPEYVVPSPANWWAKPSVDAALDTGRSVLKDVSWRVLPRDSTLSLKDLRRLAQGASEGVGPGLGLLGNPRVRGTSELLTVLGRGAHASLLARELLFQLHGDALARDARADTAALATVIQGMHGGDHPDIAQPLAHNPVVREDERLLRDLIRQVYRDSVTCSLALEAYASRWPLQHEFPTSGPADRGRAYEVVSCEGPPDLGRRELPRVRVVHTCGTTFRIRNERTVASDITWDVRETGETGHAPPVPGRTHVRDHRQFRWAPVCGGRHNPSHRPDRTPLLSGRHGAIGRPGRRPSGAILSDPDSGDVLRHHGRRSGSEGNGALALYDRSGRSVSDSLHPAASRPGLHVACLRLAARRTPRGTGGTGRRSGHREGTPPPIVALVALPTPRDSSFVLTRHAGAHESEGDARMVARRARPRPPHRVRAHDGVPAPRAPAPGRSGETACRPRGDEQLRESLPVRPHGGPGAIPARPGARPTPRGRARRRLSLRPGGVGDVPRGAARPGAPGAHGRPARGRGPARALRRRADRGRQAVSHRGARYRGVRAEGLPAGDAGPAHGRGFELRARDRRRAHGARARWSRAVVAQHLSARRRAPRRTRAVARAARGGAGVAGRRGRPRPARAPGPGRPAGAGRGARIPGARGRPDASRCPGRRPHRGPRGGEGRQDATHRQRGARGGRGRRSGRARVMALPPWAVVTPERRAHVERVAALLASWATVMHVPDT